MYFSLRAFQRVQGYMTRRQITKLKVAPGKILTITLPRNMTYVIGQIYLTVRGDEDGAEEEEKEEEKEEEDSAAKPKLAFCLHNAHTICIIQNTPYSDPS